MHLRPRRRYGQHFLHDRGILGRMIESIGLHPEDHVLEIGPGLGALTEFLLTRLARLHVVEIDRRFVDHLRRTYDPSRLVVIDADVLNLDLTGLARHVGGSLRLVGNLPYNVSTVLLFHCLDHVSSILDLHVLLQREVVRRMAALPGSEDYGRLTVMVASRAVVTPLFEVGPGAFRPPPRVHSEWIRITPHRREPFPGAWSPEYADVVKRAFQQRRKFLGNTLEGLLDDRTILASGIDPASRAGVLTPVEYGRLALSLRARRTGANVDLHDASSPTPLR